MKNISGTITSGGASQVLHDPQGQPYHGYWIRNNSATVSVYINELGAATAAQPSLEIKAGELYETPPNMNIFTDILNIYGATTATSFSGRVW